MKQSKLHSKIKMILGSLFLSCTPLFYSSFILSSKNINLLSQNDNSVLQKRWSNYDYADGYWREPDDPYSFDLNYPNVKATEITTETLINYVTLQMYIDEFANNKTTSITYDQITSSMDDLYSGNINALGHVITKKRKKKYWKDWKHEMFLS